MPFSVSRSSVAVCTPMLTSLGAILDKADVQAVARKFEPQALLGARLFPDMFTLARQVQAATDGARNIARLAGQEPLKIDNTETSFAELGARIATTVTYLNGLSAAQLDDAADKTIAVPMGSQTLQMAAPDYLFSLILPNFFFHVTTAYAILRHNGIEIGKRDYLGMR